MPRRQFIADLQKALSSVQPPGTHNIKAGEDDGQFEFEFVASSQESTPHAITITAMIPDVSDYPASHEYMIFCGDNTPSDVAQAIQNIRNTSRKTVFELIDVVSASLTALTSPSEDFDGDQIMGESQEDVSDASEDEDADDVYGDDDEAFDYGDQSQISPAVVANTPATPQDEASKKSDKSFRDRIRSDLYAAKGAGFKVGHLGSLMNGCSSFVAVSIRMSKLNLSEEVMQAWKVDPSEYLILLIQYPNGYKTGEQLQAYDNQRLTSNIGMQVFAGKRYKPTLKEAINAFTKARQERPSTAGSRKKDEDDTVEESSIQNTFISKSLSMLLEKNLIPILRFRSSLGMDWSGAEAWYNQMQRASSSDDANMAPARYPAPEVANKSHPEILRADHYLQKTDSQHSFPLLAMQFALRHFVRCTEFCLICHDKLKTELEAIKPYVCERPLCLFQYMSLGFGPSIEHEIISQPYVVDLLVSFCYSSAKFNKLKEYPDGLNLMVPPSRWLQDAQEHTDSYHLSGSDRPIEAQFDCGRNEVVFSPEKMSSRGCPVAPGQWIVVRGKQCSLGDNVEELHCRVRHIACYPIVQVDEPVVVTLRPAGAIEGGTHLADRTAASTETPASTPKLVQATITKYSLDFSLLKSNDEKCEAICRLLDTLPSVNDMRKYLSQNHPTELRNWVERLPRDVTSLLRWIIASNRSCIMQVDHPENGKTSGHKEERLHGVAGSSMQFRFAMGAPDKESRFTSEVRKTAERLSLQYPTIFAWHGSPLHNWHMIIREGLHFKNTDHGRAYGHGVYHAKDASTSSGYSARAYGSVGGWMNSTLRVSSALALNEIVNAPEEFVSHNPYYVVPQLDWIQTRYLLVQCSPIDESVVPKSAVEAPPQQVHPQDPKHTPRGHANQLIVIPASAIKSGRAIAAKTADKRRSTSGLTGSASKRFKDSQGDSIATAIDLDSDDTSSVVTDVEDIELFRPEVEPVAAVVSDLAQSQPKNNSDPDTDFVPGTLDFSNLPLMPTPTYATSGTTSRLLNELRTLAKVQSSTPVANLGWSIDTEKIDNVYQWIVELHSFHTFSIKGAPLPLVEDMKVANATSIVLEIRFGPDFPFSPPYIRVIRPRFLPFTQGGGGHIVIGGAMCMELLTNSGWSSVMSMESVLLQVRMAIASEPFARLAGKGRFAVTGQYGPAEAAEGYIRACASHGWTVPPGFREVAYGMSQSGGEVGAGAEDW